MPQPPQLPMSVVSSTQYWLPVSGSVHFESDPQFRVLEQTPFSQEKPPQQSAAVVHAWPAVHSRLL